MNKTKLYSHLGGIVAVLIAVLVIIALVLTPLSWYPWLLFGVVGATFTVLLYAIGYYYVRNKIDDI